MNTPVLGSLKIVQALPSAQYTASTNGDMFKAYHIANDPMTGAYIGWFKSAAVYVTQTAGSGNNPGVNQMTVKLQGRIDSSHGWADMSMTAIAVTANSAAQYFALVNGPLLPELRIVVTESGTADATFDVHVALQGDA